MVQAVHNGEGQSESARLEFFPAMSDHVDQLHDVEHECEEKVLHVRV